MYKVNSYIESAAYEGSLYDCAEWLNGTSFKSPERDNSGIPIIKIEELKSGITKNTEFYSGNAKDKFKLSDNDLLYSWSGNPETSLDAFFFNLGEGILNQHIFKISPKKFITKKYFFYYLHFLKPILKRIARDKQTTGLGHITIRDLKDLKIKLPSIEKQDQIVDLLDPFDEKIRLNQKINKTLETTLYNIFKAYFVDFENINSLKEENYSFPYTFKDSELGKIPKGWSIKNLSDLCSENDEKIKPELYPEQDYQVFDIPAFDSALYPSVMKGNSIFSQKNLISNEMILISKLNPNVPRIWNPRSISDLPMISSTEFVSLIPKHDTKFFILSFLKSYNSIQTLSKMVTGTSSSHQRVMKQDILEQKIICPPMDLMKIINKDLEMIYKRIEVNLVEINHIKKLRELIIPKVVSGKLNIFNLKKTLYEEEI